MAANNQSNFSNEQETGTNIYNARIVPKVSRYIAALHKRWVLLCLLSNPSFVLHCILKKILLRNDTPLIIENTQICILI